MSAVIGGPFSTANVLLNVCSTERLSAFAETFAERKQTTSRSVCCSEQRWRRPRGPFNNAKVLYIAQTMGDKGRISARRPFAVANRKQNVRCTERSPSCLGGMI